MKKVILPYMLFVGALVTSTAANAGLYGGVDVGYTSFASGYKLINASSSSKSGQLFDLHGGYRLGEFVAAEIGYAKIAGVKATVGGREENINADLIHGSALLYLPIPTLFTALLDIYGRVGIGYTKGAAHGRSDKKTTPIYGVGAEFNYLPVVAFRAEIQHIPDFAIKRNALTTFKVGVNVKF